MISAVNSLFKVTVDVSSNYYTDRRSFLCFIIAEMV